MVTVQNQPLSSGQRASKGASKTAAQVRANPVVLPKTFANEYDPSLIDKLSSSAKEELKDLGNDFDAKIDALHQKENPKPSQIQAIAVNNLSNNKVVKILSKFLDDKWGVRIFFALGNEIAESLEPSLHGMKMPKSAINAIYKGLWSLAVFCTSNRVIMKGINENSVLSSLEILLQDGIAAIGGPTLVARLSNFIQDKVFHAVKLPGFLRDLIRPIVSITACKKAVHALDPIGIKAGKKLSDLVRMATAA